MLVGGVDADYLVHGRSLGKDRTRKQQYSHSEDVGERNGTFDDARPELLPVSTTADDRLSG